MLGPQQVALYRFSQGFLEGTSTVLLAATGCGLCKASAKTRRAQTPLVESRAGPPAHTCEQTSDGFSKIERRAATASAKDGPAASCAQVKGQGGKGSIR